MKFFYSILFDSFYLFLLSNANATRRREHQKRHIRNTKWEMGNTKWDNDNALSMVMGWMDWMDGWTWLLLLSQTRMDLRRPFIRSLVRPSPYASLPLE
jgi:hypothetical protein